MQLAAREPGAAADQVLRTEDRADGNRHFLAHKVPDGVHGFLGQRIG